MVVVQLDDVGPSTVIEDRYRCAELVSEADVPGGPVRVYRAFDEVLWRPVAVHVVAGDHPRAEALVQSARTAAALGDRRLLAVYDAHTNGIAYVIREWFDGRSLDNVLGQGVLEPRRAARITLEVAEALAVAHASGLSHRRLDPAAVLLGRDESVKVVGLAIAAAIEGPADPATGTDLDPAAREDARDLGLVLHACLTGRWGGTTRSRLGAAPRDHEGRLLAPRQVRAGLPRSLDLVVDRAINDTPHAGIPLASPAEVAAALVDAGVGDPVPVFDLPPVQSTMPRAFTSGTVVPSEESRREATGSSDRVPITSPEDDTQYSLAAHATPDEDESAPATVAAVATRADRRRLRSSGDAPDEPPYRRRRIAVGAVGALILAGLVLLAWQLGTEGFGDKNRLVEREPTTAVRAPADTIGPLTITAAGDFDPGGNQEEHPEKVALAHDGDPSTSWVTSTYKGSPALGNLKKGVGLWVDLGEVKDVESVSLILPYKGSDLGLYVPREVDSSTAPEELDGWRRIGGVKDAGTSASITPEQAEQARFVLVWLTSLPPAGDDSYRGGVSEIEVRG